MMIVMACQTSKPLTGLEQSFFEQLKASVSVTYRDKQPIYKIYSTDKLFLMDLEKHLFTYQHQKRDVNEVLKNQTILFLEKALGKPSAVGTDFVEYYLRESCLRSKENSCTKLVVKWDPKTKWITDFSFVTTDIHFSH
jgi:hypothetical protein